MSDVRVRFAPSPTGVLHLGGARTALFNYLFARNQGGKFLLRIEDTDRERSTDASTQAILDALTWLGMAWDDDPVYQSSRIEAHKAALQKLIDEGKVYKCYCTPEERKAMREKALAEKRSTQYDGRCDGKPYDPDKPFVWRFRMPKTGQTVLEDLVQGTVVTPNEELEDLVIARSDGSPLYNFVVVIDDAAMGITHVIRGKDHLTNTPKQIQIYEALGLKVPKFAHLPLILGLSKRLRSAGIESYRDQGYLPEAVNNYIVRLGWSHGDQERFTGDELEQLFTLEGVNRSEGALNMEKMAWLNQQHIQEGDLKRIAALTVPFLEKLGIHVSTDDPKLLGAVRSRQSKARTLVEMAESIAFYFAADDAIKYEEAAAKKFLSPEHQSHLGALAKRLARLTDWTEAAVHDATGQYCDAVGIKLKDVAQPCRVALTGSKTGPGLFEMMAVLGQAATTNRLNRAAGK
jgi:glutamyl-tRNA synthetase